MNKMNIVFGIDDNFAMQCNVTIVSICENNRDNAITFHIITDSLSDDNFDKIKTDVSRYNQECKLYRIDNSVLRNCPLNKGADNGKISTYFRFMIPDLLKCESKALYLDADIICRKDLNELYNSDIDNFAIGVIPGQDNDAIYSFNRLRYDKNKGYFNAGVLLLNLNYWRNNNVYKRSMEYIDKYGKIFHQQDQDALNFVLQDEKKNLPLTYNIQEAMLYTKDKLWIDWHYFDELDEAVKDPAIIHYTSALKPWYKECYHPFKDEWWKYLRKTSYWKNYKATYRSYTYCLKKEIRFLLSKMGIVRKTINNFRNDL